MSVHWTCPSLRDQDPGINLPNLPCPGHKGDCQVIGTAVLDRKTDNTEETDE